MTDIFLTILNMSVTAAFVIVVLCLARLVLKKMRAPKWISYALWAVAGFKLVSPFKPESAFSLIPFGPAPIPKDMAMREMPRFGSGISIFDNTVSASLPAAGANPLQMWTAVGAYVWIFGVAAMLLYAVLSYIRLMRRKDSLETPFVYGFIKPKIHIPGGISGERLRYVTLHEQTHIKRHDHLIKPFAFALLCVHWFNPFAWLAFVLLCADMEMSCDERVLRELGIDAKADYSQTLLSLSINRRILGASPLAFGEGGIKERVKNVLKFQKPTKLVIIAAVVLAVGLTAGLAVNRADAKSAPVGETAPAPAVAEGTVISNGTGQVSADGGQTWMDEEAYQKLHPSPDVVWWTYDEYKEWLEEQKKILPGMIGGMGGYYDEKGVLHQYVLTREKVDEAISLYEQVLESIRNGAKISKDVVDGGDGTMIGGYSLNPSAPPSVEYGAGLSLDNGNTVNLGSFATAAERLAAVEAFCDKQVKNGKMTRQEADNILNEYR